MRAIGGIGSTRHAITRSAHGTLLRYLTAAGVVLGWLGLAVLDAVLSLIFWTEPNPAILIYTAPVLAVVPWILKMAAAKGSMVVYPDHLEIRHGRLLKRPIFLERAQVSRVLIDDGSTTGRARFPTGDVNEPLLWTDPVPRRQHADRPLIGDGSLPNLAIVLTAPLRMSMARSSLAALAMPGEIPPPRRDGLARALLLPMAELDPVRIALAGWPTEEAAARGHMIPEQVAASAERVGQEAAVMVTLAMATAMLLLFQPELAVFTFIASLFFIWRTVSARRRAETEARAFVSGRIAWDSADGATALAAIDANFGNSGSHPPPSGAPRD
jgi:hypothetical protein